MMAYRSMLLFFALIIPLTPIQSLSTPFGEEHQIPEVVFSLLQSPAMERLKGIDQSGIMRYTADLPAYSRYEHSLGVYMLLRNYGASLQECVAGLLHDASHTVFSHVGDFLFDTGDGAESYQDHIHAWHLKSQGVDIILANFGLSVEDILPDNGSFQALEQELPDMCADRIEYNLHTALLFGVMSEMEIQEILRDLHFENGLWFFEDPQIARRFASLSLYFTNTLWAEAENLLVYHWTAQALRRAIELNEITMEEIHFSVDEVALNKLLNSQDALIRQLMGQCYSRQQCYAVQTVSTEEWDLHLTGKFRGIDPLVRINGSFQRLTALDEGFAGIWNETKQHVAQGFYIKETVADGALNL